MIQPHSATKWLRFVIISTFEIIKTAPHAVLQAAKYRLGVLSIAHTSQIGFIAVNRAAIHTMLT